MSQDRDGVYLPTDAPNVYESTGWANSGWYDEGQHGGALTALVSGHVEEHVRTLGPMQVSRLTVEISRVVPLVPLRIETEVVREGKRIQIVQAHVYDPSDVLLVTAIVQRLRVADLPLPPDASPPPLEMAAPEQLALRETDVWGVGEEGKQMFHRGPLEIKEIHGSFDIKGPGAVWSRLTMPIVAGTEPTPLQRLVSIADFPNGVSRALDHPEWVFVNPDLTVHVSRYPEGEWIALDARSMYGHLGRGLASGTLWDTVGWVGMSTQTLYLDRSRPD